MSEAQQDEHGRPQMPLAGSEAETLLGFLDYQRATLAWKCAGLDGPATAAAPPDFHDLGGDAQAPGSRRGQLVQRRRW